MSLDWVRTTCLALPEAFEIEAWGHPTFRVGSGRGKMFCVSRDDGSSVRLKADPDELAPLLAQGAPFFVPPYVGHKGWIGIDLEHPGVDLQDAAELLTISYALVAPKRLATRVLLDEPGPSDG